MAKTIGIIGGMGPLAAADMMNKIITYTSAEIDQEHLHIIVDNNPKIPDRSAFFNKGGLSPASDITKSAQLLEKAGADILVIACNLAHYFVDAVQESINIPILNMQVETAIHIKDLGINKVGLLAVTSTVSNQLYHNALQVHDVTVIEPNADMQKRVMKGILSVKSGDLKDGTYYLEEVAKVLIDEGAEAIIAGCTEVPIVLQTTDMFRIIDATKVLAKSVIKLARE